MENKTSGITFYPFAYALLDEEIDNYCWTCLQEPKQGEKLKRCSACQLSFFCGRECQASGWTDHKLECKALTNYVKKNGLESGLVRAPDIEFRMLGRIVTRYATIKSGRADKIADFYKNRSSKRDIMELAAHTEQMRKDVKAWEKFEKLHADLLEYYGQESLQLDKDTIFELHCRNYINRHAISDKAYLKEIGKGLYLDLCAYNHSCRPNAVYTCDGFVATLRALAANVNLEDRQTTFYTYIDMLASKQERRRMLKESWYFDCECVRCTDDDDDLLTSIKCPHCEKAVYLFGGKANKNITNLTVTCTSCLRDVAKGSVTESMGAMRFVDGLMNRNELDEMSPGQARIFVKELMEKFKQYLPYVSIYYVRLIQAIIRLTSADDVGPLLDYHLRAEECMRLCYPANHPALGYHLMNIGIFMWKLDRKDDAKPYLEEGLAIIDYVLGSGHPLAITALQHLQQ